VNLTNEGLTLFYGTPDAMAPGDDGIVPRIGASLMLGASPPNPVNSVAVRYRVDGGHVRTVPGRELHTDFSRNIQYFAVTFPPFYIGDVVEYSPVLCCAGRQAPAPHIASRFPSKFRLAPQTTPITKARPARWTPARGQRYEPGLDFVATVYVAFASPRYFPETAAGVRVNFFVCEGTVEGDGISGKVVPSSSDHLIVRRDGMGVVRIRAAFEMSDGALLDVESGGYVDFGAGGFAAAKLGHLPDRAPLVVSPLITTRHPKYKWLSGIQCIGVGETHLDAGQACYHVYAATARNVPRTP
jgi:hypothetical protein